MAARISNTKKSESQYIRVYDASGGFEYTENMYLDRRSRDGALESIPGFRRIYDFGERINNIFLKDSGESEKHLIIHAGKNIYRFNVKERDSLGELAPIACLAGESSFAFEFGDDIYVMDGEGILRIDSGGEAMWMTEDGDLSPYIPTLYINGEKCEERNYLTDKFIQRFKIHSTEEYRIYSDDLTYSIIDLEKKLCAVTGTTSRGVYFDMHIPPTTVIDGTLYKVTEIADRAFENFEFVTAVYTANNLEYIGEHAFDGCTSLETVVLSDTVRSLGYRAFYGTTVMSDFYLGLGFEEFAEDSISLSSHFVTVCYAGDEKACANIKGFELVGEPNIIFNKRNDSATMGFPIKGDVLCIDSATLDVAKLPSALDREKKMLTIHCSDKYKLLGREVVILGRLNPVRLRSIIPSDKDGVLTQSDIIQKCTVGTAHDGRVFLSGNPSLPGAVFYSSKDKDGSYRPLYFAEPDFFVDGVSNHPITSMLSAHGTLTVFKAEDDGSGSIFCHTSDTDSGGRRYYPLTYTHGGVSVPGGSYTLYDDALFLSSRGLCALEKVAGSNYRALRTRSTDINGRLLEEDLSRVKLTEWQDYLVMSCDGHMYLGDSGDRREGKYSFEYKWYYINGIGTYENDFKVYRYSESAPEGFSIKADRIGARAEGTVMSIKESEVMIYYTEENGVRYTVYPTDERYGGEFLPATSILGVGELLFFGTEGGSLCLFNNDKRGLPPPYVADDPAFDAEIYMKCAGDIIHPHYYTFDSHAVSYIVATEDDCCDIPHLEKCTVPHSVILNAKAFPSSVIYAEVCTDSGETKKLGKYAAGRILFSDTDFNTFTFSPAPYLRILIGERECGWVQKRITLRCDEFRTPIGIISLIYRFSVKGNIKNDK